MKRVSEMLEDISNEICQNYCVYGLEYEKLYEAGGEDLDAEYDKMLKEHCNDCPLMKL